MRMKGPKKDYPMALKKQVGLWLKRAPRGSQKIVAQALNVSTRTLRAWKQNPDVCKRRGRRRQQSTLATKKRIAREWVYQGYTGSRPIIESLPGVRVREIREVVAKLKMNRRRRARERILRARTSIKINQVGVVAAMDGATIQKGEDLVVVRDRGSLQVSAIPCKGSLSSADALKMLEQLKQERRLPYVLCTDNGSPFCSLVIKQYLESNNIIHLRSLPRVPQHNGSCENAVRELKELLSASMGLRHACDTLNECRKRRQLNWKTSIEVDISKRLSYNDHYRGMFYREAKLAIKSAVFGMKLGRELRKREREAILSTLERFKLITIIRGGQNSARNRK